MPIKFEIKIHVYFFIKQNKNSTRITGINNIRAHHRELIYHRTPAVSMKYMCVQIRYDTVTYTELNVL